MTDEKPVGSSDVLVDPRLEVVPGYTRCATCGVAYRTEGGQDCTHEVTPQRCIECNRTIDPVLEVCGRSACQKASAAKWLARCTPCNYMECQLERAAWQQVPASPDCVCCSAGHPVAT